MDPAKGYRGLRRRSCSMGLLAENRDDSTPAFPNFPKNLFWIVRLDRICGREDLLRACHSLLNLRRRTPQTLRVELSVRVCVPRCDALSPPPPRALYAASKAVAQCSAFPAVSGARGRASTAPPSPKSPAAQQLPESSIARHRAAGMPAADPEEGA